MQSGNRSAAAILLLALGLCASCRPKPTWHETTLFVFDTVCEVKVCATAAAFQHSQESLRRIFLDIEEKFSPGSHDRTSLLVLDLFRKARTIHRASNGAFDITVAPLSRLYGFLTDSRYVPGPREVQRALERVGMEKVRESEGVLVLPEGMAFDWGGIAKGLAVDLAIPQIILLGISHGFINAGGDLYCWGENPEGMLWQVGIRHPRQSGLLGVLSLSDQGAATSGDYQRYFEYDGVRYHHIFDPKTGLPARGKQSVTVIGPETAICDGLSTALFVSREPERILAGYPDYGAVLVNDNGQVTLLGKPVTFKPGE